MTTLTLGAAGLCRSSAGCSWGILSETGASLVQNVEGQCLQFALVKLGKSTVKLGVACGARFKRSQI